MRIGLFLSPGSIDKYIAEVRLAKDEGYATVWSPQIFGHDTMTVMAITGREVPGIELGTDRKSVV